MNKKISIIVPTYNVEKYIAKCLDSLVVQDYDNYDVLVVNDGSPYNEQIIIDEYVKKFPNIIKSYVKENGGYGSVLEFAFNESDSEYVLICDPDDYLKKNALSTLMSYRDKHNVDLVVGAKYLVFEDSDEEIYDPSFNSDYGTLEDGKVYKKGTKEYEMLYFMEPSPHAKLYKREIVKNIKFPHKVSYTDNLLYFYTLTNVDTVTYCKEALSYYLINREGNTRTDLKPQVIDAWVTVFKNIIDQAKDADDIFYYRMFEGFYSIYYKIDSIAGDNNLKKEKYNLVYELLEKLKPHKEAIIKMIKKYEDNTDTILNQKEGLLSNDSKNLYNKLVNDRLGLSIKSKIKKTLKSSKLYDIYHFHAKYQKTKNDPKIVLNDKCKCEQVFDNDGIYFFGYYDKPCIAYGKAIGHHLNKDSFDYNQVIDIMIDDKKVSSSKAWNFQQGSMTSWIDEKHIIHNDFDGKKYISKIVDINSCEYRVIDFPIYSLSKNKNFSLSLNFSRLAKLRKDYGYFNLPYSELKKNEDDGIYYVDIKNNKSYLWLSLKKIIDFKTSDNMINAIHKVNHIDISPDDTKAIFLHRWFVGKKKYTRLLCVDIETKELHELANNEMVSHMCWYNNDTVFGYLRGNNNKDGYFFINMEGNQKQFVHELLVDDGHPTVMNERYIVTDAYPDYTCKSKLMLIDLERRNVSIIGRFYSYKKYQNDYRCDLHPRFDLDKKGLTIDSVYSGKRNVYHITMEDLL